MNKQQDIELIEQYLDNQLNQHDLSAFNARVAADAEFRASVDLQRQVQAELANAAQIRLLHTLHEIVQTPFEPTPEKINTPKSKPGWWIVGIIALIAAIFFIYRSCQPLARQTPSQPQGTPEQEAKPLEAPPPQVEAPAQLPKTSEPMAVLNPADFQPNRILDPLVGSQLRGGANLEAAFTKPADPLNLTLRNGRIRFRISGNATADEPLEKDALQLLLFRNRDADFLNNMPVQKYTLALSAQGDSYQFSKKVDQILLPGLYYLVLAEKNSIEPLAIQKITVTPPQ